MTHDYDTTLRQLDAADGVRHDDDRARAAALLERVITTEQESARPTKRRLSGRRLALVPVGAAVAVAAAVFAFNGPGGTTMAYASWTPSPSTISGDDLHAVVDACRAQFERGGGPVDFHGIPVVLSERRGDYVAVVFADDNPQRSADCLAHNVAGSGRADQVSSGSGGSTGPASIPPATRITQGGFAQMGDEEKASFTDGQVGADVVGVTIHAGDTTVTATVSNGHYAAWWPGASLSDMRPPANGEGDIGPDLSYDVTLADGTVLTDVDPATPR
jgi:hypothetical protein